MSLWIVPLFALLSATPVQAEYDRLDCGLRVVVIEDHTLPLVSVQLWFHVGSAHDPPSSPGTTHVARAVLEDRTDAALRLRATGAEFTSDTRRDGCYFATLIPSGFLAYAIGIEAEHLRPTPTSQATLADAVQSAARPASPMLSSARHLLRAAFSESPLAHPPGIVAASLADVTPGVIDAWLERWFIADNATLFVIGAVDAPTVKALVRDAFRDLPRRNTSRAAHAPLPPASNVQLAPSPAADAGVDIAWVTGRVGLFDNACVDVLMEHLCNPIDGPLHEALRDIGCRPPEWSRTAWSNAGLLTLRVDQHPVSRNDHEAIVETVRSQLRAATERVITPIGLNRARAMAKRRWRQQLPDFASRALELARHEVAAGDALLVDLHPRQIARVFVDDVRNAATKLLEARMVILPRTTQQPTTDTAIAPLLDILEPQPANALSSADAYELLLPYAKAVSPIAAPSPPGTLTIHALNNGVTVRSYRIPGATSAVVRTMPHGTGPLYPVFATLMALGARDRSVDAYRDYLTYHGLDLYPRIETPTPGLESRGSNDLVPQMMELQADLLRSPRDDDDAMAAAFQTIVSSFALRRGDPPDFEREEYYVPPGLIGWWPTDGGLPRSPQELRFSARALRDIGAVDVLVVGDVAPEDVRAAAELVWDDWRPAPAPYVWRGKRRYPLRALKDEPRRSVVLGGWIEDPETPFTIHIQETLLDVDLPPVQLDYGWRALGWIFGAAYQRNGALDARREWRWRWLLVEPDWLTYVALPEQQTAIDDIEAFLARSKRLKEGTLPDQHLTLVRRYAICDRLLAMNSVSAIADLLEFGITNPWDTNVLSDDDRLRELLKTMYRVRRRDVVAIGPPEQEIDLSDYSNAPRRQQRSQKPTDDNDSR